MTDVAILNKELNISTVLILHGIEGRAGIHWQQWLHDQLIKKNHQVIMPTLPNSDYPDRQEWLANTSVLLEDVDHSSLIITGHSLGVVTALDYLETTREPIEGLISVSGFAKDYQADLNSYFLRNKEVDFEKVNQNLQRAKVLFGDDDPYVPQGILKDLADQLKVEPKIYPQGGHLNTESGYSEFPDLLTMIDKMT